ncbi:MAG: hypothetical protein COB60_06915 [Flavobacteriaceae bacterium]|nr:MAG: hypothetical protein COB60_06915 [Flavobacteriaceae bacterium]
MKKHSLRVLALTLIGIMLYSCQKEDDFQEKTQNEQTIEKSDPIIGLGKKLENPYSVENMRKAYQNLQQKNKNSFKKPSKSIIQATDYYVRFLPKDDQEKEILQEEDELMLFDMPLDYELEEGVGGAYHDPTIPLDQITWQYTVVPIDYQFRDIKYEKLSDLYLQDDEGEKKAGKSAIDISFWYELEDEALKITGNEDDLLIEESTTLKRRRKWYPSGTIRYEDNTTSTSRIIPLQGVQIVVKRWFKWKRAITNASGYFKVGKFRSKKVKCAIKWERHSWDIRSGSYGQAWYSFESLRRGKSWNKIIRRSSTPRNWLYASIHRGAMEYFYNHNSYGIRKPYNKSWFLKRRLHIGAKHKSGRAHYFTFNKIIWSAPVVIYSSHKNGVVQDSRDLFATTVHELAHVSHWEIGYSTAQFVIDALADDPFLPESWAVGVEYVITERVYPKQIYGIYDFDYQQQRSLRYIQTSSKGYTPIVIDMIDDFNQSTINITRPIDRVSGYTLGQIEEALPGSFGSWCRIWSMYTSPTDGEELDYLFREYR